MMSVRASAPGQTGLALDEMDPQKLKAKLRNITKFSIRIQKYIRKLSWMQLVLKKVKEETDKLAAAKPQDQPKANS